ncbi:MAG TPA: S9 family peptidase [Ignavibacteria bacterium]
MKTIYITIVLLLLVNTGIILGQEAISPPIAKIILKADTAHGDVRLDPYAWLRDKDNPEVMKYLQAENKYTESVMSSTQPLQDKLFEEMKGRIPAEDESLPYKLGSYYYYSRNEKGKSYSIRCRKMGSLESTEEVVLDENEFAYGKKYFSLGEYEISYDHNLLAFSFDTTGAEKYIIKFKDLRTGKILHDEITNTGGLKWFNDNKTILYTTRDDANRIYKVYRHVIGTDLSDDKLLYHEKDEAYDLFLYKSKDRKYIFALSDANDTREIRYVNSEAPDAEFKVLIPRKEGVKYYAEHFEDKFSIRSNEVGNNYEVFTLPVSDPVMANKKVLIPHRDNVLIENVEYLKGYAVVKLREEGLVRIQILDMGNDETYYINFDEPSYMVFGTLNKEYNSETYRYSYLSLTTPETIFDYDLKNRTSKIVKMQEIPGGYNKEDYKSERIFATSYDGTQIPISLVYKKGLVRDGNNPALMFGYGAYGGIIDPDFSSDRISLLDRGFIWAIAHVRGGGDLGQEWYNQGKMLNKKNSFYDFIACAEHLINEKYTNTEKFAIEGGSAGGLLMGAVINMRPHLFKAVLARVAWVDVLNDMFDKSLPGTPSEHTHIGNPEDKQVYYYMKSYSPYDNVISQDYPAILTTCGLNDSRVFFWEPAKWVAKLRALKTDNNVVLLQCDLSSGHLSSSDRYAPVRQRAYQLAFILDQLGIKK